MKISLAINLDHSEIDKKELIGFQIFNFGDVYLKYEISVTDIEKYSRRQKYLSKEISLQNEDVIILGNPCYDTNDIIELIKELKKYNLSLNTIYIPSDQLVEKRKQQAFEENKRWGYREGVSDEEIERNFQNFRTILLEIKNGLKDTLIKVKEV